MSYEYTEYPTYRYHRTLPPRLVNNKPEDLALGDGWADSPARLAAQPSTEAVEEVIDHQGEEIETPAKRGPGRPKKAVS